MRKIDPIYWLLRLILLKFFKADLSKPEEKFIEDNLQKHRWVLWLNVLAGILTYFGVRASSDISSLVLALIAPVAVMGTAWFAISFGAIPRKLMSEAMAVTFWMFLGFSISLVAMFVAVAYISPIAIWPILAVIYISAIVSCIKYDTADGLKAGLDDAMLMHSRYAISYYKKSKIKPSK